jgi:plastocyanin
MGGSSFFTAAGTGTTTLSVAANTAVTWTNDSGITHNVTFDDPATALAVAGGASGNIGDHSSGSHQRQFAVSGSSHPFHCTIHGTNMHGTVNVQ